MRVLKYFQANGSVRQPLTYFSLVDGELEALDTDSVPQYSPYEAYASIPALRNQYNKNMTYPVQNGYVFDCVDIKKGKMRCFAYVEGKHIILQIGDDTFIFDENIKVNSFRLLNYCRISLQNREVKETYRILFPFNYMLFADPMSDSKEVCPFYYLAKEWEQPYKRNIWVESWLSGRATDRWINP